MAAVQYGVKIGTTWKVVGTIDAVALKAHAARLMRNDEDLAKDAAVKQAAVALLKNQDNSGSDEARHARFSFGDFAGDEIREAIGEDEGLDRMLTMEEAADRGRDKMLADYKVLNP